jgi:hypothetical protein
VEAAMERIYLYVPPEEYTEVKASGACWDEHSKRWYVPRDQVSATWSRWMGDGEDLGSEAEFGIGSEQAFVATAQTVCVNCHERTEVICIYGESGTDIEMDEALSQFTVSNIWAMDSALRAQLAPWPSFRNAGDADSGEGHFANHCAHCGAMQEDCLLHSEPGDVFFCIPQAEPGSVRLTPLVGRVRMSGDCSFGV